jgi:hypothetical protein
VVIEGSISNERRLTGVLCLARLPDGRVLAIGADARELYDPASGSWRIAGGPMSGGPLVHSATLRVDERILATYEPAAPLFDPKATP